MRALGHLLLWLGFVGGAFCAVHQLELPDKWATIPWLPYGASMCVGIVGIVLLRKAEAAEHLDIHCHLDIDRAHFGKLVVAVS